MDNETHTKRSNTSSDNSEGMILRKKTYKSKRSGTPMESMQLTFRVCKRKADTEKNQEKSAPTTTNPVTADSPIASPPTSESSTLSSPEIPSTLSDILQPSPDNGHATNNTKDKFEFLNEQILLDELNQQRNMISYLVEFASSKEREILFLHDKLQSMEVRLSGLEDHPTLPNSKKAKIESCDIENEDIFLKLDFNEPFV
jgi:hypothetical protein